jgi:undecaprenyl-diphosphatase
MGFEWARNGLPGRLYRRLGLGAIELKTVLVFAAIGAGVWLFWSVAEQVTEGDAHEIDRMILLALREGPDDPVGPAWLEYAVADITALGGYAVLTLLVSFAGIYLLLQKHVGAVVAMVGSIVTGTLAVAVFKAFFDRARPDVVEHLTHATSSSFPSGHASAATLTYLTLGLMVASAQNRMRTRAFIVFSALLIAVLVGFSRVYLGVHWPSDVVAGWGFGAAWAIAWWFGAKLIARRGAAHEEVTRT